MSKRISQKTKQMRRMGTGEGASYLPYITTSEFNSLGTTSVIRDWKTGRGVHCLSQGEALWYYILRWDDDNVDIREQFPLENNITVQIARENGIKHPRDENYIMTTDFLVTKKNGSLQAYSVKPNKNIDERTLQILCIEKLYWDKQRVPFQLLFADEVNKTYASNIRLVTEYYSKESVFDEVSRLKHLIAIKKIPINMYECVLDVNLLITKRGEILWKC